MSVKPVTASNADENLSFLDQDYFNIKYKATNSGDFSFTIDGESAGLGQVTQESGELRIGGVFGDFSLFGRSRKENIDGVSDSSTGVEPTTRTLPDNLKDNPVATLSEDPYPQFDKIKPEHFMPALDNILTNLEADLKIIESNAKPTWEGVVAPLMAVEYPLSRYANLLEHYEVEFMTPEMGEIVSQARAKMTEIDLRIKQSKPIYEAMLGIKEKKRKWNNLDDDQKRVLTARITAAELGGIALTGEKLTRFNEVRVTLSSLYVDYGKNRAEYEKNYEVVITDKSELAGMPDSYLEAAAERFNAKHPEADPQATAESGPYSLGVGYSSYRPLIKMCDNRELRERMYRANASKASSGENNNTPVVKEILKLRREQAQLLGYNNFAEISLATRMASTPDAVIQLEEEILEHAKRKTKEEFAELEAFAKTLGHEGPIQGWDYSYFTEKLKEQKFGFTDESTRAYFPFSKVEEGMFSFYENLFGIEIKPVDGKVSTWDENVRFYEVKDTETGELLGEVYYDPFSREGKYDHAWYLGLRRRHVGQDGNVVTPLATLNTNYKKPKEGEEARVSYNEIVTIFHEFGHCLQGVLSTQRYDELSGTSGIERDGVEIASQVLENFLKQKEVVLAMSEHEETGETMPEDMFEQILSADTYMKGYFYNRQIYFGLGDMKLHAEYDPFQDEVTPQEFYRDLGNDVMPFPLVEEDNMLNSFSHLFAHEGYAAGYYGYLWADVRSADYFTAFEDHLDDPEKIAELGGRLRDTLFATGGGKHPDEVFDDFMGREPNVDALLRQNGYID